MPLRFVPAMPEHADAMAPRLRDDDVRELAALGMEPLEALRHCLAGSIVAETCLVDEEPGAMWGAVPENSILGEKALVWMLGTEQVPRHAFTVLLTSKKFIMSVQAVFPVLECLVDMRYSVSIRWVKWLGFEQEQSLLINNVPFAVLRRRA